MAECLPTQRIHQSVRLKITGFLLPLLWHFGREESICTMSNYLSWKNSVVKNRTWTLFIGIPTHYHSEVVPGTYDALCFICLISIFSTLFWALWRQGSSLFFFYLSISNALPSIWYYSIQCRHNQFFTKSIAKPPYLSFLKLLLMWSRCVAWNAYITTFGRNVR